DGGLKRTQHDRDRACLQPQVVDPDVERPGGVVEEGMHALCDGVRRLSAVGQKVEVERGSYRCDGGYRASPLGSPASVRGSSMSTGSGLVAIAAASCGAVVTLRRVER